MKVLSALALFCAAAVATHTTGTKPVTTKPVTTTGTLVPRGASEVAWGDDPVAALKKNRTTSAAPDVPLKKGNHTTLHGRGWAPTTWASTTSSLTTLLRTQTSKDVVPGSTAKPTSTPQL